MLSINDVGKKRVEYSSSNLFSILEQNERNERKQYLWSNMTSETKSCRVQITQSRET